MSNNSHDLDFKAKRLADAAPKLKAALETMLFEASHALYDASRGTQFLESTFPAARAALDEAMGKSISDQHSDKVVALKAKGIDPSWHITGNHPVRECAPMDREDEACWIARFPSGFQQLQIAVWGDGLNESDACESACEWLKKKHPAAISEADEENCYATRVSKADVKTLQNAGTPPLVAEKLYTYSITGRRPDCDNVVWADEAASGEAALRIFADLLYEGAAEEDGPQATHDLHGEIMYVESMVSALILNNKPLICIVPPEQISADLENMTFSLLAESGTHEAVDTNDDLPCEFGTGPKAK